MQARTRRRVLIWAAVVLLGLPFLGATAIYIFRDDILQYGFRKAETKLKDRGLTLQHGTVHLRGLNRLELGPTSILRATGDTMVLLDTVSVSFNPLRMLFGQARPSRLFLQGGLVSLRLPEDAAYFRSKTGEDNEPADSANKMARVFRIIKHVQELSNLLPYEMDLSKLRIAISYKKHPIAFDIPRLELSGNELKTRITLADSTETQTFAVQGTLEAGSLKSDLSIKPEGKQFVASQLLASRLNLAVGFAEMKFGFEKFEQDGDQIIMNGQLGLYDFAFRQPKLDQDTIHIRSLGGAFKLRLSNNGIELDSSSHGSFNNVPFSGGMQLSFQPVLAWNMHVETENVAAQRFFYALPPQLFPHLQGIVATGSLHYSLHFAGSTNRLDTLRFHSSLSHSGDFSVKRWGAGFQPGRLNGEFAYRPYGSPRVLYTGPSDPLWVPWNEIPEYVKRGIVTTEDATYWHHQGFNEDAIRAAIVGVLRYHSFAKGGSTISQQLVKNVFLSRQKLVSRKMEEALMVWLIETLHISSKQRMMEVYLNVIEWGPEIYGIREAAGFYFDKHPMELSLSEALFLCMIVPNPKGFRSMFDSYGDMRGYKANFFRFIVNKMLSRGLITEEDRNTAAPYVRFRGPAGGLLHFLPRPADSNAVDSLEMEEFRRAEKDPDFIGPLP